METPDCPDFRVAIRRGRLHLVPWGPWMYRRGPLGIAAAGRGRAGVALVDLTVVREGGVCVEAVAAFLTGQAPAALATLTAWSRNVGYRRLWLPGEIVEHDGGAALEPASVVCPACRARWTDSGTDFWLGIRRAGHFPTVCPLCGGDLPQWAVCQHGAGASDSLGGTEPRRTACM